MSNERLARYLAQRREDLDVRRSAIERAGGIGGGWISHLEKGSMKARPKVETLEKVASGLVALAKDRGIELDAENELRTILKAAGYLAELRTPQERSALLPAREPGAATYLPTAPVPLVELGHPGQVLDTWTELPVYAFPSRDGAQLFDDANLIAREPWPGNILRGATAAMVVAGDELAAIGVHHGDHLLVAPGEEPQAGDDVLATVGGAAAACRFAGGAVEGIPGTGAPWRVELGPQAVVEAVLVAVVSYRRRGR